MILHSIMAARDKSASTRLGFRMDFLILSCILAICSLTVAEEQMTVIYSPNYLRFTPGENVRISQLPDILSAVWDFSTVNSLKWSGMDAGNPFKRPEAIVAVEVEGLQTINLNLKGDHFPLETDVEPGRAFELTADRTYVRFAEKNPILLEILNDDSIYSVQSQFTYLLKDLPARPSELEDRVLGEGSILEGKNLIALNASLTPDMKFFLDLQLLLETSKVVNKKSKLVRDGIPDLYWFRITGLQELLTVYDVNSPQIEEATELILDVLKKVNDAYVKAYDGNVLLIVLGVNYQSGGELGRFRRNLLESSTELPPSSNNSSNIQKPYDPVYPAMFNIIFLVMLIISLSIFGISLGIWHMDPGRDSIIYRMTSNRMKKDQ